MPRHRENPALELHLSCVVPAFFVRLARSTKRASSIRSSQSSAFITLGKSFPAARRQAESASVGQTVVHQRIWRRGAIDVLKGGAPASAPAIADPAHAPFAIKLLDTCSPCGVRADTAQHHAWQCQGARMITHAAEAHRRFAPSAAPSIRPFVPTAVAS
jgi:hypothetical protein